MSHNTQTIFKAAAALSSPAPFPIPHLDQVHAERVTEHQWDLYAKSKAAQAKAARYSELAEQRWNTLQDAENYRGAQLSRAVGEDYSALELRTAAWAAELLKQPIPLEGGTVTGRISATEVRTNEQALRDQSEDRPAPQYLVQYREGRIAPWEVVRARDRVVLARFATARAATYVAVQWEAL